MTEKLLLSAFVVNFKSEKNPAWFAFTFDPNTAYKTSLDYDFVSWSPYCMAINWRGRILN